MDLERFLEAQAKQEAIEAQQRESEHLNQSNEEDPDKADIAESEKTLADRLGFSKEQTASIIAGDVQSVNRRKRFERTLDKRYYVKLESSSKPHTLLSQRIASYKFKKKKKTKTPTSRTQKDGPKETKIHKYPLSQTWDEDHEVETGFKPRDPRFPDKWVPQDKNAPSGWQLRNAYKFLDEYIDRDMGIIEKSIAKNQRTIKYKRRNTESESPTVGLEISEKYAEIKMMKRELLKLKNRKNTIKERDLQQSAKSEMRKTELEQVRKGVKTPYHHSLERTRFGQIKLNKKGRDGGDEQGPNIQNVYLQKKYDSLKQEGRLEQYMNKKRKRVNSKFRVALKKRSGAGWNDMA